MDLEQSIYRNLVTSTALTDLVSSSGVFPMIIPQGESLPAIAYNSVSVFYPHAMVADPNIQRTRVQISSWSTSYSEVRSVAKQVVTAMRDFNGRLGSTGGVIAHRVFIDNEAVFHDFDSETNTLKYHIAQDYMIWWSS